MKQGYLRALPCGVFLAAIFACTPAFGVESGSYIDSPDGEVVYGYSYVQLDYTEDWEYDVDYMFCSSTLYDPDGTPLDSADAETSEGDYVEADVSGANGSGEYSVVGDGQVSILGEDLIDLGETSDSMDFTDDGGGDGGGDCGGPPGCILPDTDTSVYLSASSKPNYNWAAYFAGYATLSSAGGYPQNTWSGLSGDESWGGGDTYSSCADDSNLLGVMANPFTFGANSDYRDTIGVSNYAFNMEEYGGWPNIPCGFFVYQDMWILCPNNNVWTVYYINNDEVDVWPDGAGGLVYDQRGYAYVYYGD